MRNWDPKPSERTYYRSREDGQRGYLVKRDGKDVVRLDRPMEEIIRPLDKFDPDRQRGVMSAHAAGKIAFLADRALCSAIGDYQDSKVQWLDLSDKERIRFIKNGPDVGGFRDEFFRGVMGLLKDLTDG